jgi:predicted DCC family thiol-disulfide oxidoreductase YuxK
VDAESDGPIVLYDGVCALCNRLVRFVLARDRAGLFRFASLQGEVARAVLARHGRNPDALDTLVVVLDPGLPAERLLDRSTAAVFVLQQLPGVSRIAGRVMAAVPASLRDVVYRLIARTRYRTFGRYEVCPLPPPGVRDRFL